MTSQEVVDQILKSRLFLILRHVPLRQLETLAQIFAKAGVSLVEVALNSADALSSIRILKEHGMLVGAGTAVDANRARQALEAGARYLVSPLWDPFLPCLCAEHDAVSIPGALTPTEIWQAHRNGADFVKIFPASSVGAEYFKAVLAPLPEMRLVAVGGIRYDNAQEYLASGAVALGVGSGIFNMDWLAQGKLDLIQEALERLVRITRREPAGA